MSKEETPKQHLACLISGYEPDEPYSSAHDTDYYELMFRSEKIDHLRLTAEAQDYILDEDDIYQVYEFLESEKTGTNDWYVGYMRLGGGL